MLGTVSVVELPEIDALIERSLLTSVDASDDEKAFFLKNIRQNLAWWRSNPEFSVHLKFSADGHTVGVVLVKNFWNLCHLFVDPSQQRSGVGSALVHAAIAQCRGKSTRPAIRVNSSRNAVAFYRKLGFVPVLGASPQHGEVQFEYAI